jgi:hypothetical protein
VDGLARARYYLEQIRKRNRSGILMGVPRARVKERRESGSSNGPDDEMRSKRG